MTQYLLSPLQGVGTSLILLLASPIVACTVDVINHSFGTINPLITSATDSTSTITVTCPILTAYTAALSAGSSGNYNDRQMTSGSSYLSYNLYSDSARTTIWGDGTGVTVGIAGTAGSNGTSHTVYGRVPHQQTAIPGSYSDSITVTVTY